MNKDDKIKAIERFDSYYAGINSKGAFILAVNTLFLSGLLIGYKTLLEQVCSDSICFFKITVATSILLSVISMFMTIQAIIPFTKSDNDSVWFFLDIANQTEDVFIEKTNTQTSIEIEKDLSKQMYLLSVGLKSKHNKVRKALLCNYFQLITLITITYLIIF